MARARRFLRLPAARGSPTPRLFSRWRPSSSPPAAQKLFAPPSRVCCTCCKEPHPLASDFQPRGIRAPEALPKLSPSRAHSSGSRMFLCRRISYRLRKLRLTRNGHPLPSRYCPSLEVLPQQLQRRILSARVCPRALQLLRRRAIRYRCRMIYSWTNSILTRMNAAALTRRFPRNLTSDLHVPLTGSNV